MKIFLWLCLWFTGCLLIKNCSSTHLIITFYILSILIKSSGFDIMFMHICLISVIFIDIKKIACFSSFLTCLIYKFLIFYMWEWLTVFIVLRLIHVKLLNKYKYVNYKNCMYFLEGYYCSTDINSYITSFYKLIYSCCICLLSWVHF